MVLPLTSKINESSHLEIGGCDAVELAKKFGTPLFVMDEKTIRAQCRKYLSSFQKLNKNTEVIYASKAFISIAMCQIIQEEGLSLDVSSGGELYLAKKANFPSEKIFMHGNNKTPKELEMALTMEIGCIVVDSEDELELLDKIASEKGVKPNIMLRITPGIKPSTHDYIQTGQIDSKFGFGLTDGIALKAVKKALEFKNLRLKGFHVHIGSQIFVLHSYAKAIEIIMDFSKQILDETGFNASEINVGGGLGIKYKAKDEPSTIEEYAEVIVKNVQEQAKKHGIISPKILIEPGRSIVGNSGVTLYTVGTIKEIPGVRRYISVDGGMSDNLRPMLYGAEYEVIIANKADFKPVSKVTIAGKHCESGDVLIKDAKLPLVEIGDILCTPATGAYGYMMANNYNKQPRPAVILVNEGNATEIIRRENYEDIVRLERPLK
ncbi:diaminopimelate decarboxylase [Candidatus Oleimmundimicrobium sp.]|uniref:diaminopimelate decarboxylase n=1 Tax=Candidatus Oleimmundimicrobium sp. TaxID=3060597 RepID=UPI0027206638|nr:diaminopimelate decarboxylase [Candidatus Oleimmundimicrobium sp.]MDO8885525.1 diaminopimelate decarboxylase [Candidatus Oleimmundimicrobium sp.]